ncbi:MAG: hypothetical protein WD045_16040 [Pirellulaceae bacterium]
MTILSTSRLFAVSALLFTPLAGCGGDGKIPIQGTATWNGDPIEIGYVELQPTDNTGQFASAEIREGKFTLRTAPGLRRVKVTAERQIGEIPPSDRIPTAEPIMHQYIPARFNTNSETEVEIKADDPVLALDLEGEEIAPNAASPDEQRRKAQQGGR